MLLLSEDLTKVEAEYRTFNDDDRADMLARVVERG